MSGLIDEILENLKYQNRFRIVRIRGLGLGKIPPIYQRIATILPGST